MTVTIDETDTDIIESLDFDFEVPCDAANDDYAAGWSVQWSCCGHITLVCEMHRKILLFLEEQCEHLECTICNNKMNLINWERL